MSVRHVFLLLMALGIRTALSAVLLTFPQARFPPLDYLPDDLTLPPCGVPKPTKPFYTTFHIGDTYNITWITPSTTNSTYRIRLVDSDGLTVEQFPGIIPEGDNAQSVKLRSPCEQCMLLVEQVMSNGKVFRSCADVNVIRGIVRDDEQCSQRGSLMNSTCQCESGFTGSQCQHYAHCETSDDCLNGGVCVDQLDALIRKRCFCSYGFFGQRCDQKFNSQNDNCFAYDELVAADLPLYGMFNPRCYQRYDLSAEDPLPAACSDPRGHAWKIERNGRGRAERVRRKPVMPKNNGYTELGLRSSLHPMDCVDMITASVRKGRLFISDFYSRDRSTPLEDYWYDGEMSLSAAYGTQSAGRTVVMFRRELREFEPTDHPLGPNEILVVWAKAESAMANSFHGSNRGVEKLKLAETVNVTFEQPTPPNEIAFGVKNVVHDRLEPMTKTTAATNERPVSPSTSAPTVPAPTAPSTFTSTSSPITTSSENSTSSISNSLILILLIFLIL
ncbi:unnamed protein product [Caenorhabditis sp. 36 PRJEB53466]|nr:unnamed protein product [Caenorhabditis sp. 36 PRJEB53466]